MSLVTEHATSHIEVIHSVIEHLFKDVSQSKDSYKSLQCSIKLHNAAHNSPRKKLWR